ncbi:MAG: iron ABC transporter permease [Rhizobiales bacterium]|nr:iron ABC transporter permease [Hyphomicrobiales bacterium]
MSVTKRGGLSAITPLSGLACVLCIVPMLSLLTVALRGDAELWPHLLRFVLPYALRDTLLLAAGVVIVAGAIGTALASLVSFTEFPGRRYVSALALLPLAFPIYLHAFVYVELLDSAGPVQQALRDVVRLPEIRSLAGAIAIFSLVLYPYVYVTLRLAFAGQHSGLGEVARTLGCTPWQAFRRVQLPAARPAFAAGISLALMEALADFGASEYLGVRTIAYSVYSTWVTRGSLPAAAQIALLLVAAVATLAFIEHVARRRAAFSQKSNRVTPSRRIALNGTKAAAAALFVWGILALAFFVPAVFLAWTAAGTLSTVRLLEDFLYPLATTLALAVAAAAFIAVLATGAGYYQRWHHRSFMARLLNLCGMGYAIPGVVLALGALFAYTTFDNLLDRISRSVTGYSTGLVLSGTALVLIFAYAARFFAVGFGPVSARFHQINRSQDQVALTLGQGPPSINRWVLLPQITATLAAAWLLLLVDIVKELPITLLLRPIGIETLATSLYGHASRGQFEDGSLAALAILGSGVAAVAILQQLIYRPEQPLRASPGIRKVWYAITRP